MSCSNCYNGCSEIVSDKCVRYTGIDVPVLGIQNGDSLSFVEQALITFLTSTLDGTGIKPNISNDIICELISQYLPTCGDITIVDICTAIIQALCTLQIQVNGNSSSIEVLQAMLEELNGNYTIRCLDGVTSSSDTHTIVQATIDKLCAFITTANSTFVQSSQLCSLVAACTSGTSNKAKDKMVPYAVVEYYGPLLNYPSSGDNLASGIGTGYWDKVYLCNGLNGTPDKRGRVSVGVTDGAMAGGTMDSEVNPASNPGVNPTYQQGVKLNGHNSITLSSSQIPAHTHANTAVSVVDEHGGHTHNILGTRVGSSGGGGWIPDTSPQTEAGRVLSALTGITVETTLTNASFGGGQAHLNIQPGIGCIYIIYIP